MDEKNNFNEYINLVYSKIPRNIEIHFVNLLKLLYDFSVIYNNYIKMDKEIFETRKEIGFKKRELERLNSELEKTQKEIDTNISSLIYSNDNKLNYDFNLWLERNGKVKEKIDDLEEKITLLEEYIENLTNEENRLIGLRSDFKYNLTIIMRTIKKNKDKEIHFEKVYYNDLEKIGTLLDDEKDIEILQKYFILIIGLKKLIYSNINILINDLIINNCIEKSEYNDIRIMMLSLIGMVDADKNDLNTMINDPVFNSKLSLLELVVDYLNTKEINNNVLEQFDHIKFLNEQNKWILELLDLLKEKTKNSNKKK